MELVARDDGTVTIKFRDMEIVDLIRLTSAAAQGYDSLDRELLDHLTSKEVGTLSNDLVHVIGRTPTHV